MRDGAGRPTLALLLSGSFLLATFGALGGCIAVSRETRRETVPSPEGAAVLDGGRWKAEQEWRCRAASDFILDLERATFQSTVDSRLERGWDLADFDVVSIPASADKAEQVCLVGTFRRWIAD